MIFEPVKLTWKGRDYVIPPEQVLKLLAMVEDVITLGELSTYMLSGRTPLAKLSKAWGIALRYAGAQLTDEEIYGELFSDADMQGKALAATFGLQALMVPPAHLRGEPGKVAAAGTEPASSPRPTS